MAREFNIETVNYISEQMMRCDAAMKELASVLEVQNTENRVTQAYADKLKSIIIKMILLTPMDVLAHFGYIKGSSMDYVLERNIEDSNLDDMLDGDYTLEDYEKYEDEKKKLKEVRMDWAETLFKELVK